jgi:trk system potassium uptake protein TrkH
MSIRRSTQGKFDLSTLVKPWRIHLEDIPGPSNSMLSPVMLVLAFALLILIGAFLLVLPVSHATSEVTPLMDALFTSVSAVCVTGLTIHDTGTYWSFFGQAVILVLIQLGGLGFMSGATIMILIFGQRIGLREKMFIGATFGASKLGGLGTLMKQITLFALIAETMGAIILYFHFSTMWISSDAAWRAVFQSISAFNNAGFDLFGNNRSLLDFQGDLVLLMTTAALVILGGIGFMLVVDLMFKRKFARLELNNKIVLVTSGILLLFGTAVILVLEYFNTNTVGNMEFPQKVTLAFFQSVIARTAGFTAIDMANLTEYCIFFMVVLMFIGGASGSTAGGIKVNTFGILMATIWSVVRGKEHAGAFGKEFIPQQIYRAMAVIMLALGIVTVVILLLTITEEYDFLHLLFEAVSAFSNTGLTIGVTPHLSTAGRLVIILTMFVGRLGTLVLALFMIQHQKPTIYRLPQETMTIG